jgi:hypothetical protein
MLCVVPRYEYFFLDISKYVGLSSSYGGPCKCIRAKSWVIMKVVRNWVGTNEFEHKERSLLYT